MAHTLPFFYPFHKNSFSSKGDFFLANNGLSLQSLFNDLNGKLYKGEDEYIAIGSIRYDIGIKQDWGYLGYLYRKEAVMRLTPDTMLFLYQILNKYPYTENKLYNLYLSLYGFEARGFLYSKDFFYKYKKWNIQIALSLELLYATEGQDGFVKGNAITLNQKDYNFNLFSNYTYTKNYLYKLDVDKANAYGHSTTLSFLSKYKKFSFFMMFQDIYALFYWNKIPYSIVNISSENKKYDKDGYVEYSPTIWGLEKNKKLIQKIIPKYHFKGSYKNKNNSFNLGFSIIDNIFLPYVSYKKELNLKKSINFSYHYFFNMFGMDFKYKKYNISIYSNHITKPSALKISLAYSF